MKQKIISCTKCFNFDLVKPQIAQINTDAGITSVKSVLSVAKFFKLLHYC